MDILTASPANGHAGCTNLVTIAHTVYIASACVDFFFSDFLGRCEIVGLLGNF